jgi:hypothetical protein
MTTYEARRDDLAAEASVLVQVLLGSAPGDMEFRAIAPIPATAEMDADLRRRWPVRGLRPVGFLGLVGGTPRAVFSEPLPDEQVQALAVAFGVYIGSLVKSALTADNFPAEIERAEVSELQRMYAMPDNRHIN